MPLRILFTADSHWSHQATLGLRLGLYQPFATIERHDEALIARWNAAVGPGDVALIEDPGRAVVPDDGARSSGTSRLHLVLDRVSKSVTVSAGPTTSETGRFAYMWSARRDGLAGVAALMTCEIALPGEAFAWIGRLVFARRTLRHAAPEWAPVEAPAMRP